MEYQAQVLALKAEGFTVREIARELGLSRMKVHRLLHAPPPPAVADLDDEGEELALIEDNDLVPVGEVRLFGVDASGMDVFNDEKGRKFCLLAPAVGRPAARQVIPFYRPPPACRSRRAASSSAAATWRACSAVIGSSDTRQTKMPRPSTLPSAVCVRAADDMRPRDTRSTMVGIN